MAVLLVHGRGVSAVNVGDSAVLELDRERLVQLTEDDVPAGAGGGGGDTPAPGPANQFLLGARPLARRI